MKMGRSHSKPLKKHQTENFNGRNNSDGESDDSVRVVSNNYYDEQEIRKLQKEFKNIPENFLLNNLLLSVMFFENYEKDKQKLIQSNSSQMEKDLSPILLKKETTEFQMPDILFEKINTNVDFCRTHGPDKFKPKPLVPKRLFVVYDNIEVIESIDELQYIDIDKPSYKVCIEHLAERPGFVYLKHLDNQIRKQIEFNRQNLNNQRNIIEPQPGPSTAPDDTPDYEYSTITAIKTPKPLNIVNYNKRNSLPKSCFTTRKIKKYQWHSLDPDDENNYVEEIKNEDDLYETISFMNSIGFMTHFQNAIFPNSLGQTLGFTNDQINKAEAIPGTIFCNLTDDNSNIIPCEIYPCVAIQWPSNQTYEFSLRDDRPIMIDKTGARYLWPNEQMIKDLMTMKCVLIPKGYYQKRGENSDCEIEWEISFPRAERYLDVRMSRAQIKSFLFLIILFKTYIEPDTKQHGLLIEHIRHHMYWECERNPKDWPELRLGTKVLMLIKSLNDRLSKGHLPNFFIRQKNMFENIPQKYLKHAQRVFHNVLESPVIYFIAALRNLRYINNQFYNTLDLKHFYKILTIDEGIKMIHGNLVDENLRPPNVRPPKRPQIDLQEIDLKSLRGIEWKRNKERLNRTRIIRQRQEEKAREENLKLQQHGSIDSIDFTWQCDKQFDAFKILSILRFFIEAFIETARSSRILSNERQSLLYLKQAYYLTKILETTPGFKEDSLEFYKIIATEEEESKKLVRSEAFDNIPPSTPKRNSAQFTWDLSQLNNKFNSRPLSYQQTKGNVNNSKNKTSVLKKNGSEVYVKKNVEFID